MNLLTEGFPLAIITAFLLLATAMPYMLEAFAGLVEAGFESISRMMGGAA
jgi:flagellar biosynthesis protein FliR